MNPIKLIRLNLTIGLAIAWGIITLSESEIPMTAASVHPSINTDFIQVKYHHGEIIDFSGTGRPNEQTDGGSRGTCANSPDVTQQLTALVPQTMGLTVSEYPTFWVYIPDSPNYLQYGELVLQDEAAGIPIDRIRYSLTETPGIIAVRSPIKPKNALQVGKLYRWYFKVVCQGGNKIAVGGLVQRVSLDQSEQNYPSYLTHQIWHDALTYVGDRLLLDPDNRQLKNDWVELLGASGVGLQRLTDKPLVNCCN